MVDHVEELKKKAELIEKALKVKAWGFSPGVSFSRDKGDYIRLPEWFIDVLCEYIEKYPKSERTCGNCRFSITEFGGMMFCIHPNLSIPCSTEVDNLCKDWEGK